MFYQNETKRHFELNNLGKDATAEALRVVSKEEAVQARRTNMHLALVLLGIVLGCALAWLL
ncbi:hypothetical protein SAMN04515648_2903 [Phyllobacterium sp. CL33Tsu]|nr:hypothetical protein SAMN04515648_2903 [Phyllobacterium sp. CL33Tsu]